MFRMQKDSLQLPSTCMKEHKELVVVIGAIVVLEVAVVEIVGGTHVESHLTIILSSHSWSEFLCS